ncbi:hypothetical protein JOM56_013783 [Amanita muscaria]
MIEDLQAELMRYKVALQTTQEIHQNAIRMGIGATAAPSQSNACETPAASVYNLLKPDQGLPAPLQREEYSNVRFWRREQYDKWLKMNKGDTNGLAAEKPKRGRPRKSENEEEDNVHHPYLETVSGMPVNSAYLYRLSVKARRIWATLLKFGQAPDSYSEMDELSREYFIHEMCQGFFELRLCSDFWKLDLWSQKNYASWAITHLESKKEKKEARKKQKNHMVSGSSDENAAAGLAMAGSTAPALANSAPASSSTDSNSAPASTNSNCMLPSTALAPTNSNDIPASTAPALANSAPASSSTDSNSAPASTNSNCTLPSTALAPTNSNDIPASTAPALENSAPASTNSNCMLPSTALAPTNSNDIPASTAPALANSAPASSSTDSNKVPASTAPASTTFGSTMNIPGGEPTPPPSSSSASPSSDLTRSEGGPSGTSTGNTSAPEDNGLSNPSFGFDDPCDDDAFIQRMEQRAATSASALVAAQSTAPGGDRTEGDADELQSQMTRSGAARKRTHGGDTDGRQRKRSNVSAVVGPGKTPKNFCMAEWLKTNMNGTKDDFDKYFSTLTKEQVRPFEDAARDAINAAAREASFLARFLFFNLNLSRNVKRRKLPTSCVPSPTLHFLNDSLYLHCFIIDYKKEEE